MSCSLHHRRESQGCNEYLSFLSSTTDSRLLSPSASPMASLRGSPDVMTLSSHDLIKTWLLNFSSVIIIQQRIGFCTCLFTIKIRREARDTLVNHVGAKYSFLPSCVTTILPSVSQSLGSITPGASSWLTGVLGTRKQKLPGGTQLCLLMKALALLEPASLDQQSLAGKGSTTFQLRL